MGYGHIESRHAEAIEEFYDHTESLSELSSAVRSARGGNQYEGQTEEGVPVVRNAMGDLRQLPGLGRRLKPGTTQADVEKQAGAESDTTVALRMQIAKRKLFTEIRQKRTA